MLRTIQPAAAEDLGRPPVFASVLCGVGGGAPSLEAARQAAALATGGTLELLGVEPTGGDGSVRDDLRAARRIVLGRGMEPSVREVRGERPLPALLVLAAHHDLLVVGAHDPDAQRPDSAHGAVHQSPVPVLLARVLGGDAEVTDRLLVADDGTAEAEAAMARARAIADRHGSHVSVITEPPASERSPAEAIVEAAREHDATLVVVGSRGLSGIAALASVSERVAADAHCSVLVVRS